MLLVGHLLTRLEAPSIEVKAEGNDFDVMVFTPRPVVDHEDNLEPTTFDLEVLPIETITEESFEAGDKFLSNIAAESESFASVPPLPPRIGEDFSTRPPPPPPARDYEMESTEPAVMADVDPKKGTSVPLTDNPRVAEAATAKKPPPPLKPPRKPPKAQPSPPQAKNNPGSGTSPLASSSDLQKSSSSLSPSPSPGSVSPPNQRVLQHSQSHAQFQASPPNDGRKLSHSQSLSQLCAAAPPATSSMTASSGPPLPSRPQGNLPPPSANARPGLSSSTSGNTSSSNYGSLTRQSSTGSSARSKIGGNLVKKAKGRFKDLVNEIKGGDNETGKTPNEQR